MSMSNTAEMGVTDSSLDVSDPLSCRKLPHQDKVAASSQNLLSSHANEEESLAVRDEKEAEALEALGQLQNSGHSTPAVQTLEAFGDRHSDEDGDDDDDDGDNDVSGGSDDEQFYDTRSTISHRQRLYRKMRNHPIVNSAVNVYKSNKPALKYGVNMVEKAAQPMVTIIGETREEWRRKRRLSKANEMFPDEAKVDIPPSSSLLPSTKRQKLPSISEALSLGNRNLNELSFQMSIESKKRLQACLQLLMLANKQLSTKVEHLQHLLKEQERIVEHRRRSETDVVRDEDGDVYHDASESISTTDEIKHEIIGTVKKIVSFISKYGGNSLPEPARTDVREELLKLPNRWASQQTTNTLINYNTNAKVLVLANDSLDMVRSVMSVFHDTLSRADHWIKQKQAKQLAKQAMWNSSMRRREAQEQIKDADPNVVSDDTIGSNNTAQPHNTVENG